jgi:hypothetical protein
LVENSWNTQWQVKKLTILTPIRNNERSLPPAEFFAEELSNVGTMTTTRMAETVPKPTGRHLILKRRV